MRLLLLKLYLKIFRPKHVIPKGFYCHTAREVCPYWSMNPNKPKQENGYCAYLKQGDWDINNSAREFTNVKTNKVTLAKDMPIGISLLWDQCKECGINSFTDEELDDICERGRD